MPLKLPNDFKLRNLENKEISGKSQNFIKFVPNTQPSPQNENFVSTSKNLQKKLKSVKENTNVGVWLRYVTGVYIVTLLKEGSTTAIFQGMFRLFFGTAIY